MSYSLTAPHVTALQEYAALHPDEETCGIIAGGSVVRLENVADDKTSNFAMTVKDVLWAIETFGTLEAVWHTHPSGSFMPSENDKSMHPVGIPMVIATSRGVRVHSF